MAVRRKIGTALVTVAASAALWGGIAAYLAYRVLADDLGKEGPAYNTHTILAEANERCRAVGTSPCWWANPRSFYEIMVMPERISILDAEKEINAAQKRKTEYMNAIISGQRPPPPKTLQTIEDEKKLTNKPTSYRAVENFRLITDENKNIALSKANWELFAALWKVKAWGLLGWIIMLPLVLLIVIGEGLSPYLPGVVMGWFMRDRAEAAGTKPKPAPQSRTESETI